MSQLKKVQDQFGPAAEGYVECPIQAGDFTLDRLIKLVEPQRDWRVLDIATGGGHTSIAFAQHVDHVVATDVTPEMLDAAERHARKRGVANVTFEYADAMHLPYDEASVDVVTSRMAAHHFEDVPRFLAECSRVLRPGGVLALVDSHVPDGPAGDYINSFQGLHDPSHVRCLSADEWRKDLADAGFEGLQTEEGRVELDFDRWTTRARVSAENVGKLRDLLIRAPADAAAVLAPKTVRGKLAFHLQRLIMIARRGNDAPS